MMGLDGQPIRLEILCLGEGGYTHLTFTEVQVQARLATANKRYVGYKVVDKKRDEQKKPN